MFWILNAIFSWEFGPLDKQQVIDFEITPFLSLFLPCTLFSLSQLPRSSSSISNSNKTGLAPSFFQHWVCIFIKAVITLPRSMLFVFITWWTVIAMSQGLTLFCPKYPLLHRVLSTWHKMTKCFIITCQVQVTFQSLPYLTRFPAISSQMFVLLWEGSGAGLFRMCHPGMQSILSWNQWKRNKVRNNVFLFHLPYQRDSFR